MGRVLLDDIQRKLAKMLGQSGLPACRDFGSGLGGGTVATAGCAAHQTGLRCLAFRTGAPDAFPVKPPKRTRPQRYGTAFWLVRGEQVLLRRRPPKGLLGGMLALPSGPWGEVAPGLAEAPAAADWRPVGRVGHIFTHFALDLAVVAATTPPAGAEGEWWPVARLGEAGLPTLFAKAARLAQSAAADAAADEDHQII